MMGGCALNAAEMTEMAAVWKAADARASERLVAELSEPVKQRVVQRGPDGANWDAFLDFWPDAHTTTNVLCAIMQAQSINGSPTHERFCILQCFSVSTAWDVSQGSLMPDIFQGQARLARNLAGL